MELIQGRNYFVSVTDTVLRETKIKSSKALNHLLLGDWMRYLGEQSASKAKMRCRGCTGWVDKKHFSDKRLLEINFIDIGQGDGCHIVTPDDQIILVDAGEGNNMHRFLSWRYNLRKMKVVGVDGISSNDAGTRNPIDIDHIVISHPDKDHYYGFKQIFENHKLKPLKIYHNGIVERPIVKAEQDPDLRYYSNDDLGGYANQDAEHYVWDVIHNNADMHSIIVKYNATSKNYLSTLRAARENNKSVKFASLNKSLNSSLSGTGEFMPGFEDDKSLKMKVLGPLTENVSFKGKIKPALMRLGAEGVTKNGHSVILQAQIGKLKVMLGGDLNTQSEDYLLKHYGDTNKIVSELEERLYELQAKGNNTTPDERHEIAQLETEINAIIAKARPHFEVDVTKACHHGSHHFSETFLRTLNPIATVISSGDGESYSHPRPDALGSIGKYGRGIRPLIFSTELARSTNEFCEVFKYFELLKDYEKRIAEAPNVAAKKKIEKEMQQKKDRNVAVYGMITLRTDGEKTILAQKLEAPRKLSEKWDIHELQFNPNTGAMEYLRSAKAH